MGAIAAARRFAGVAMLVLGWAAGSPCVAADPAWPTKPITWIVPFAAGGITDATSRAVASRAAKDLGQTIVIDNKPGAGGMLAAEFMLNAPADGYTLLYGTTSTISSNPALYKNVKYKPLRDFVPVHAMFASPMIMVVSASRPYRNVKEFVEHARANPGKLFYASAGNGTGMHLMGELFQGVANIRMTHVPYKGSAAALTDLIGGNVDVVFDYAVTTEPHIRSGRLRALMVTGTRRLPQLAEVPTSAEAGYPQAVAYSWAGIFVHANTPPAIVTKLQAALHAAMTDPEVVRPIEAQGSTALADIQGPAFRNFVAEETVKWTELVRRSGATAD